MSLSLFNANRAIYFLHCCCATGYLQLRDHARGLDHALRAVAAAPNAILAHSNHCMLAVGVGDIPAARAALSVVQKLAQRFPDRQVDSSNAAFHRPEDRERIALAFRIAAGLKDPATAQALR